jgi:hypothetical protein
MRPPVALSAFLDVSSLNLAVPQGAAFFCLTHRSVAWIRRRARGDRRSCLPSAVCVTHAPDKFVVSEAEAAAIRTVYEQRGEPSAAVELRRLFPGIIDNVQARECARTIAGWKPLPGPSRARRRSNR